MNISTTMVGLFKTAKGPGNLELRETPVPQPMPNEALIEVKAAGICGTDLHIKHDLFPYWPPVILGHEFSGMIIEVGEAVTNFHVGDRVVAEPHTQACGKCELCRTGHIQLCALKRSPGWGINGAFARYITMPEHLLHHIPDSIGYEEAALVEPAANIVQDVLERARVVPDDFVIVTGPGPMGLLSVMATRAAGAKTIVLIGTAADEEIRLPLGRELGADEILVSERDDIIDRVNELTSGRGADLVIEASGAPAAIVATPYLVRRLGRIAAIGMTGGKPVAFPWDTAIWKVCKIIFNLSTGYTSWERAIGLIHSGKLDVKRLITHTAPLDDWERIFNELEKQRAIKALIIP